MSRCSFDLHFLMMTDAQHLCKCIQAIAIPSLDTNIYFSGPLPMFNWYVVVLFLSCRDSLYILDINPSSHT